MWIKLGNTKSMTDEHLEIIEGVAIIMKEGGALVAVGIATVLQMIQIWMIILLLLASVRVIVTLLVDLPQFLIEKIKFQNQSNSGVL